MRGGIVKFLNGILIGFIIFYTVWLALALAGVGYYVPTGSMKPAFMPGDMVIIRPVTIDELVEKCMKEEVKPVIVFDTPNSSTPIIHRINKVVKEDGRVVGFQTKGDNNAVPDAYIVKPEDIRGMVIFRIPLLGYPIILAKSKVGRMVLGSLLAVLIVLNIFTVVWERKKGKGLTR